MTRKAESAGVKFHWDEFIELLNKNPEAIQNINYEIIDFGGTRYSDVYSNGCYYQKWEVSNFATHAYIHTQTC